MIGLAAQSSRWKHTMENEVAEAARKSAQASLWQDAATNDETAADELAENLAAEQADAKLLHEEGESLIAKGDADQAKAVATEEDADAVAAEAAETEAESAALVAQAAAAETVVEEDIAEATAHAALAAEDGAAAEVDEASTALCQLIPLVDIVCDVVGGVAAVGLESQSARSAVVAAEEYSAAAAAQVEADSAAAEATELQATAAEEGEEASTLQSEATALEVHAKEELEDGAAEEAAADEQLRQSVADQELSTEEQAKAITEEDASAKAWKESMQHGANACGSAIMTSLASSLALLFWIFRIARSVVMPMLNASAALVWKIVMTERKLESVDNHPQPPLSAIVLATSHVLHHGLLFILFFGLWGDVLLRLRELSSIKSMGGIILGFSASVAAVQVLLLHALPNACQHTGTLGDSFWKGCREFARRVLVLCPLLVMEILLVWVNVGSWAFVPSVIKGAQSWWLWIVLALGLSTHYWFLVKSQREQANKSMIASGECQSLINDSSCDICEDPSAQSFRPPVDHVGSVTDYGTREIDGEDEAENSNDWEKIESESTIKFSVCESVWTRRTEEWNATENQENDKWFLALVLEDFKRLRLLLVFEILMASIMLALLRQSTPALRELWPASKAILLAALPHLHLLLALVCVVPIAVLVCACL